MNGSVAELRPGHEWVEVCDPRGLEALEYGRLKQILAGLASTPMGAEALLALQPSTDETWLRQRYESVDHLRQMLAASPPPRFEALADPRPALRRLGVAGAVLQPQELESIARLLAAAASARAFLDQAPQDSPLRALARRVEPLVELRQAIEKAIAPGPSIASSASPALERIRQQLSAQRRDIERQLNSILSRPALASVFSDRVVTTRKGRFVLVVRTDAKGRLKGIIHDTSASGASCYLEPMEVVEANNRLSMLKQQEQREIRRVLKELSDLARVHLGALRSSCRAVEELDCLLAIARFASALDCHRPLINPHPRMELKRVRHPLLAWAEYKGGPRCVPVDITAGGSQRIVVISGANAGGKTAAVKCAGLVMLMAMSGLPIPARAGSSLWIAPRVLVEIGDEQDLSAGLSTFSAHLRRLKWMLETATEGTLCLIDELGAATDPEEGSALGVAVLEALRERGAVVICTTHLGRLKAFGATARGAVNASVGFDPSGRPTYQLHYGLPGASDALAVAGAVGMDPRVIARARQLLGTGQQELAEVLARAREALEQASSRLAEAEAERAAARKARAEAERALEAIRAQRATALADATRQARKIIKRMRSRLEQTLAESTAQGLKPGKARSALEAAARQGLEELNRTLAPPPAPRPHPPRGWRPKVGERVRVPALGQQGTILELEGDKAAVGVGPAGVRVVVAVRELLPAPSNEGPASGGAGGVVVSASSYEGLELNLIGMRVEEALEALDKAIDQAVVGGRNELVIVHGIGTGRLRAAVREYLEAHPMVSSWREPAGRAGASVAQLKD